MLSDPSDEDDELSDWLSCADISSGSTPSLFSSRSSKSKFSLLLLI